MKSMVKTAMCAVMASMVSAESLYNPLKSTVKIYNDKNFDKQVTLNREKGIGVVKFYKSDGKFKLYARDTIANVSFSCRRPFQE